jgi:hypothetical protein
MGDFPDGGWDLPTTTFEDAASTLLATLTSTAIYASETLFNPDEGEQWGDQGSGWGDEGSGMGAGWNSSIPHMGEDILPPADSGNYFLVRPCKRIWRSVCGQIPGGRCAGRN